MNLFMQPPSNTIGLHILMPKTGLLTLLTQIMYQITK